MSGVKGRSGRKSMRDEERRLRIIEKAWLLVGEILHTNHADRYRVATELVLKDLAKSGLQDIKNIVNIQNIHGNAATGTEKANEARLLERYRKLS